MGLQEVTRSLFAAALLLAPLVQGCASPQLEPADQADVAEGPTANTPFGLSRGEMAALVFPAAHGELDPGNALRRCTSLPGKPPPRWLPAAVADLDCPRQLKTTLNDALRRDDLQAASAQDLLTGISICGGQPSELIARGADVNGFDSCGVTALVAASAAGNEEMVAELLAAGAVPDLSTRQGRWSRSPLLAALVRRDAAIAASLLNGGADANTSTAQGRSALMFAVAMTSVPLVERLLQAGADPCQKDASGLDAPALARIHESPEIEVLVTAGCRRKKHDAR